jgi:WD40 repeat protein
LRAEWSPDGARIVTASVDRTVRVWEAATGKELARLEGQLAGLEGHSDPRLVVAWSPDGVRILTVSEDETPQVWEAATGKAIARLEGHGGIVYGAAWSPDGARILTASLDKTARVWEAATGKELARLVGHGGQVLSATWSPFPTRPGDTVLIVTTSADGSARLWRVFASTQDLVNAAKDHIQRCLTTAQRKQYFLAEAPSRSATAVVRRAPPVAVPRQ